MPQRAVGPSIPCLVDVQCLWTWAGTAEAESQGCWIRAMGWTPGLQRRGSSGSVGSVKVEAGWGEVLTQSRMLPIPRCLARESASSVQARRTHWDAGSGPRTTQSWTGSESPMSTACPGPTGPLPGGPHP